MQDWWNGWHQEIPRGKEKQRHEEYISPRYTTASEEVFTELFIKFNSNVPFKELNCS